MTPLDWLSSVLFTFCRRGLTPTVQPPTAGRLKFRVLPVGNVRGCQPDPAAVTPVQSILASMVAGAKQQSRAPVAPLGARSPDGPVFRSQAVRDQTADSKSAEYTNLCKSTSIGEGYATHLGYTPGYRRGATGAAREQAAVDRHPSAGGARFASAVTAYNCAIRLGTLPEWLRHGAGAGLFLIWFRLLVASWQSK